jgi:hypothetical protein
MPSGNSSTGWAGAAFALPGKGAFSRTVYAKAGDVGAIRQKGVLMCVTDGSPSGGCHELVAETVAQSLIKSYYGPDSGNDIVEALRVSVQQSVVALEEIKDPRCVETSVALAAVVIHGAKAYFARVGNAMVYAVNAERIALLTTGQPDFGQIVEGDLMLEPADRLFICTDAVARELDESQLHAMFVANDSAAAAIDAIRAEILRIGLTQHGSMTAFDFQMPKPEIAMTAMPIAVQQSIPVPPEPGAAGQTGASALAQRMREVSHAADAKLSAEPVQRPARSGQRPMLDESQLDGAYSLADIAAPDAPESRAQVPVEYARTTNTDEEQERLWRDNASFSAPIEETLPKARIGQGDATPEAVAARRGQRSADDADDLKAIMAGKKPAAADAREKSVSREESVAAAAPRHRVSDVGRVQPFNGEAIIIPARRTSRIRDVKAIPTAGRRTWLPDPIYLRVMGIASLLAVPLVLCAIAWATGLLSSATNRSMLAVGMITPIPTSTPTPTPTVTPRPTNTPVPTATAIPTNTPVPTVAPTQTPFVVVITAVPTQTPIPTATQPATPTAQPGVDATATPPPTSTPRVVAGEGTVRRVVRRRPVVRAQPTAVRRVVRRPAQPQAPVVRQPSGGGQPPLPPPPP